MKIKLFATILLASFLFTACKTQEDIRRERTVESLNEQMAQNQKISANSVTRFQVLEEQISKLSGNIEEMAHNKGQDQKEVLLLKEKFSELEENNKKQNEAIKAMAEKLNEQSKYIEQVISSLSTLSEDKATKNEKKKSAKNAESSSEEEITVTNALKKYKSQEFDGAKKMFEEILDRPKLKGKDKSTTLFYLGNIEYKKKNYEDAKVYYSKLFTEHPDSMYNPSALLNLAKCFIQLKGKEEAKQTLEELVSRYPKSKEVAEAQKLLTKL